MKNFMVLYHAPASAVEATQNFTPEEMQKGMQAWATWAEKCGEQLVDLGNPLGGGQRLSESGSSPSDNDVTGYSIVQAEDITAAQALLQDHPHLGWAPGCTIAVYETMPMPM